MPEKSQPERSAAASGTLLSSARTRRSLGLARHGGGVPLRLVLLGTSVLGTITSLVCVFAGHPGLGARVFAGVVVVLVGLLLS